MFGWGQGKYLEKASEFPENHEGTPRGTKGKEVALVWLGEIRVASCRPKAEEAADTEDERR